MKKYKLNKGFITQKLGNKLTIFDSEESILYTFNETASYIFQKLKLGLDLNKIENILSSKYKIKKEKARRDIDEFLKELIAKGIVNRL